MPPDPRSWLPLSSSTFHILLALEDRPRHGFAIIKIVEQRSAGDVHLQTGALYRALKHLRRDGLIDECDAPPDETSTDERRRYYRATRLGIQVVAAEVARITALARIARSRTSRATRPRHA